VGTAGRTPCKNGGARAAFAPGRRGRCHPRPPQIRTCRFPASGSSRESFADDVVGDLAGHPAPPRLADRRGIHAFSSVWLSMSFRGQGLQGSCPFPCFPAWSSPRDASLPSVGSQRAWFPAVTGTMKALRLPICVSMVTYWFASTAHAILLLCVRRSAPEELKVPSRPGPWVPAARISGCFVWTPMGSLRSSGDPSRAFAPLQDPGRTDVASPLATTSMLPPLGRRRRLRRHLISGLTHAASAPAGLRFTRTLPYTRKARFRLVG